MSVEVINEQGGSPPTLGFVDSFNRPDEPFFVGNNWYPVYSQGSTYTGPNLAGAVGVGAAQLTFTQNNGLVANCCFIPRLVSTNKIVGRNQFSQLRVSAYNLAGPLVTAGPGVWLNPQGPLQTIGYYLRLESIAGVLNVRGIYGFAPLTGIFAGNPFPIAVGDTIRIEARDNGASNQIKLIVNGSTLETANDATANRPRASSGIYGIVWESGTVGGTASFQNFLGGVL